MVVGGEERKAHYFAMDLPQSDDCFVMAFPAETTEAFLEGHNQAFAYFGGVPTRFCTTTPSWRWRGFWATARGRRRGRSPSCRATICSPRSSDDRPRATTKARWRGWWATRGGTSWCRFRASPVGRS